MARGSLQGFVLGQTLGFLQYFLWIAELALHNIASSRARETKAIAKIVDFRWRRGIDGSLVVHLLSPNESYRQFAGLN
jgi:hypothetical protein